MTQKELETLQDMVGFIEWSVTNQRDFQWILSNLGHDITGLLSNEPAFLPRTSGYRKESELIKHRVEGSKETPLEKWKKQAGLR